MNQSDLVSKLDAFFQVEAFDESAHWAEILSPADLALYQRFARPEFVAGPWNGLMLDCTAEIDRVYLVVFPGQAVLDTILALEVERGAHGALIFAHHPADFEEGGRGFLGISDAQVEDLREHHISYYCCHAPLDAHPEISTGIALAKTLKLRDWEPFAPHGAGYEGLHGRISDTAFEQFAERLAEVTDLPHLRYSQVRFNGQTVEHVAIIPGGGDHPEYLQAARELGCDTYVTGQWWPRGHYDYAARQRESLRALIPALPMNLLGTSHYASEMVVLRDLLPGWFRSAGIEARFIRQPNPWR
jgi:putative NIF3 family GTP cyclohydrolase 1 type 2